jgi:tRNA-uridine 2-sulfurtransferase
MIPGSPKRVVVGMSGGVDSSVAAALLQQQGYEVIGVMLRLWSDAGLESSNRCCTPDAMAQARRVAAQLGIPFYALDAQDSFRDAVVRYFIDRSEAGSTPNPCIYCNRLIRWGFLYEKAVQDFRADFIATGHYAQVEADADGTYHIYKGIDPNKDQSYVLHHLTQEKLAHTLLPLGKYRKPEIRLMAKELGFSVANRPDSQDLCFLGGSSFHEFFSKYSSSPILPGKMIDRRGKYLGDHKGLPFYTIGQRKGLMISAPEPYYVIEKHPDENVLVVGFIDELGGCQLQIGSVNWISGAPPASEFNAQVKIRYKAAFADARITVEAKQVRIAFEQPLRDITPGQFAVIYCGDEVIGGGEILGSSF